MVIMLCSLSGWIEKAPGMARDHQFFVGRNHPGCNPAARRAQARAARRIGGKIKFHPEPGSGAADPFADRGGVLADAGGEHPVSYTPLRAHETGLDSVCRLLLEKKTNTTKKNKKHHSPRASIYHKYYY